MTIMDVPGSKSITARALFLAAAARGTTALLRPLASDDSAGFAEGLATLGYRLEREPDRWTIEGRVLGPAVAEASVFCRDAATRARFLPVLAAIGHGVFHFDASAQMRRRPLGPLTQALRELGVAVVHPEREGYHPLTIHADGIKGGHVTLDAGLSSQFLTALLLVGPLTADGLTITVTDLVSAPYVDITVAMMERFGVRIDRDRNTFTVPAQFCAATDYAIEPDASTASYFLAAAALTGQSVTVRGLGSGWPAYVPPGSMTSNAARLPGAYPAVAGSRCWATSEAGWLSDMQSSPEASSARSSRRRRSDSSEPSGVERCSRSPRSRGRRCD
jgi:3-phosphoshikimate 1-carboxyvinyltransferase